MLACRRTARAIQRRIHTACAIAVLVVLAAPAALGAAMTPVLRELGAQSEHVCKCGMAPGRCGCPECARLERERRHERLPVAVATIKTPCDVDGRALANADVQSAVPAASTTVFPASLYERLRAIATPLPAPCPGEAPPVPPPRMAAA
jgi:hypothetical protein